MIISTLLKLNAKRLVAVAAFAVATVAGFAQTADTLVLNNGDDIVGEIKDMTNAIVQIETPYSDSDFKIDWDEVREILGPRILSERLLG